MHRLHLARGAGLPIGTARGQLRDEHLGLGGLGVPHDAGPVVVGVEGYNAVVADPELFPAAGVVQVLGGETQEAGIGVDRLLPLD